MQKSRNLVGWITLLSGVIGLVSYFLVASAVNFNFDFFSDSSLIFSLHDVSRTMLKWSMITDMFGYYLLLLPILFFIHEWMQDKTGWRHVFTFCGASYIFAGALGASILGAAWPALLDKYPTALPEQQEMIKISFENFSLFVVNGIWNLFDAFMFGVWFIAIGVVMKREYAVWGWITIVIGLLSTFDFAGNIFGLKAMADTALNLYLVLAPIWAIAVGVKILQSQSFLTNTNL